MGGDARTVSMHLKIVSYNINSVRIRLDEIRALTDEVKPDILCLQEIKVADEHFPAEALKRMGYKHIYMSGQKSYHGVAILSRIPLEDVSTLDFLPGHKRHIAAKLKDGTEIHNFYIPAGGDIPDPKLNQKFDEKLRYYASMTQWAHGLRKKKKRMIMLGDFNVAPLEHDVWSHKQLLKIVSHTPVETAAMAKLQETLDWVDTSREFVPAGEKLYSWWSYRNQDWAKSDRGRRLDHIWITPNLKAGLKSSRILRHARDWKKASDHVPVVMELEI
jgi:exodeoxyribonuclease-3